MDITCSMKSAYKFAHKDLQHRVMVLVNYAHIKLGVNSVIQQIVIYAKLANKDMYWTTKFVSFKMS